MPQPRAFEREEQIAKMSSDLTLSQLFVYPVKGCRGIALASGVVCPTGLRRTLPTNIRALPGSTCCRPPAKHPEQVSCLTATG